ncbi:hypothetical protein Goklo_019542 [Gossypium klotzschianum]|nr:hypothetical protein [Gossypium klotzschianum]
MKIDDFSSHIIEEIKNT